jgi:carboxyl-terminal processing protease
MSKARFAVYAVMLVVLSALVVRTTTGLQQRADRYAFFDPLIDAKRLIVERYVDPVDEKKLQLGALNGMVEALGDPYTVFVPAEERAEFAKDLTGEYVGIGAMVQMVDGWLTIVTPLEDSPAFRAGIMAGDRVVEIEGRSTMGLGVEECVRLLMGEPGTQVSVVVERKGVRQPVTITRAAIKTRSVKGFHRERPDSERWMYVIDPTRRIGYVRITQFTPRVSDEVREAVGGLLAEGGLGGLVLDLRWNPGGLLPEAVAIADMFLRSGTIVSTRGRAVPEQVFRAREEGTLPDFPMAVILNEQSASASEVLAGALVENGRAIAVGTRSFGKGSVQVVIPLDRGGGELKITEQGYFLPSGRSITRRNDSVEWGVDPTDGFYVPLTNRETIEMLRVRREQDVLHAAGAQAPSTEERWSDPDWIVSFLKDKQLGAALSAVQQRIDTGAWHPTGRPMERGRAVVGEELRRARQAYDRLAKELARLESRIGAMETGLGEADQPPTDLWADDLNIVGGRVRVLDAEGRLIAELEITGEDLERWLLHADVRKVGPGN